MALKGLGEKIEEDEAAPVAMGGEKKTISYPSLSLPLELVEDMNLDLEDNVDIVLKGKVQGLENTTWNKSVSFELRQGDITKTSSKEDDKDLLES